MTIFVMFQLADDKAVVCINPDQVAAIATVASKEGASDIVLTARALTYRVKGSVESVVARLASVPDYAEPQDLPF